MKISDIFKTPITEASVISESKISRNDPLCDIPGLSVDDLSPAFVDHLKDIRSRRPKLFEKIRLGK